MTADQDLPGASTQAMELTSENNLRDMLARTGHVLVS